MPQRRPTITDVARRADVSKGAVSFALNGRAGVSSETRARILAVADELGWQPSLRGRSFSSSRAFACGLVLARPPELLGTDPFFPSFIAGVETVLGPAGISLVLQVVGSAESEEAQYRKLAGEGRVDGVFLTDLRVGDPRIALLQAVGLPAVTLNRPDIRSPFPAICMDDQKGIREAVRHLVALGHRRIAHVSGPLEFLHSLDRRDAWVDVLAEAGLEQGPLVVSDFTAAGGAAATAQLLDLPEPPTAIVFTNDLMAMAGLGIAHSRGLQLPEDLSVTGFDGTELALHMHPSLTTVTRDPFGWGQTAASALLAVIDADPQESRADIDLEPGRLEIRGSTTAPATPFGVVRRPHKKSAGRRRSGSVRSNESPTPKEKT